MTFVPQTPTPIPPIPDIPPIPPIIVGPEAVPAWVPYVAALGIIAGVLILWPIVRALARRIEGRGGNEELRAEIDGLFTAGFERLVDEPVPAEQSIPAFAGHEYWMVWRRRADGKAQSGGAS